MRVAIIGLNWLGDILMSFPAICSLAQKHEVYLLTREHLAEVYSLIDLPIQVVSLPSKNNLTACLKTLKPLRAANIDISITLPHSFRAALIAHLIKPAKSIGFATQMRNFLLSDSLALPDNYKLIHESKLYTKLLQKMGLIDASDFELAIKKSTDATITTLGQKIGFDLSSEFVLLAPGAAFGSAKRWPPHKFAELLKQILTQTNLKIIITASASESKIVDEIAGEKNNRIINLAGKTSLLELACLCEKAKALVANDSGTMHLAAIYSTPTVVPIGPTDPIRTGALNKNVSYIKNTSCPLAPCRKKVCPLKHQNCMQNIEAAKVFEALKELISP